MLTCDVDVLFHPQMHITSTQEVPSFLFVSQWLQRRASDGLKAKYLKYNHVFNRNKQV